MKLYHLFCLIFILVINCTCIYAASAVAWCRDTSTYGYSYGHPTESKAQYHAIQECYRHGGKSPHIICSTNGNGYGAIAISANGRSIGASVGHPNQKSADNTAIRYCRGANPSIQERWND